VHLALVFGDVQRGQIVGRQTRADWHIGHGQAFESGYHTVDGLAGEVIALRLREGETFEGSADLGLSRNCGVAFLV
jgi:hypothetical protein